MAQVQRTLQAYRDMQEIWVYVAQHSPDAADRLIDSIDAQYKKLAENPGMGRQREELLTGLRSFPIGNYVIYYRQNELGILVQRVVHGSRQVEYMFPGDLDTSE